MRLGGIALSAALSLACHRGATTRHPSGPPSVVLISVDTLRSDHLPAYGYKGVATPNIDALRNDSILFQRAYSPVPLTLPSHASIMTGLLPADHTVRDNIGFRLPVSVPTIAETLKKQGYATGGAVSAFVLRRETGIARGFDFYDDETEPLNDTKTVSRMQRDGHETLQSLDKWLGGQTGKRFFAFLHLYEPHSPYTPPEPYYSRYANRYDGEIAYADAIVGAFLRDLKEKGVYDDALIIFLSDHGEGLNDHGEDEHGIFLYREALQVPLLVKLPMSERKGQSVQEPVALIDVFPTILERTQTAVPAGSHYAGGSLLSPLRNRAFYAETFYPRFHFGWSDLHSLIEGNDHYIRAPQPELYDLSADPAERSNVMERNRRAFARLRTEIEPFVKAAPAPANIDREEAEKLASLGYLASSAAPSGPAPDPKTLIGSIRDIHQAFEWYGEGNQDQALAVTNKLLASNPQITDLWDLKCKILNKQGHTAAALDAAKEGLRHVPVSIALLYDVANAALALGRLDEAAAHAELAAKIEPGEAQEILARISIRRNDPARAEREAKLAVESAHDPTNALMIVASLEARRGDFQAALGSLDRATEAVSRKRPPKWQNLHLSRGDVLARLNRNEEAEREFRMEIRDFPKQPDAYSSLVLLLVTERRLDDATRVIYDLIAASPEPHSYAVAAETLKAIGDDRGAEYWSSQGRQRYPADKELRELPKRLREASRLLQSRMAN
ncbi:MAG: sulfatase-like hydrolase/transferase [Thermoanaerobaculia bacterium]